jgi:hypothetical protein
MMSYPMVQTTPMNVAAMSIPEKLGESIRRSIPLLPDEAKALVMALLSPSSLETIAATTAIWIASHAIGIGELADLILLLGGFAMVGKSALEAGKALLVFATTASQAKSEGDLNVAAEAFAKAVILVGVTTVTAVLLRKSAGPNKSVPKPNRAAIEEGTLYERTVPKLNLKVLKQLVIDGWKQPGKWPVKVFKLRPGQKVGDLLEVKGYVTTENAVAGAGLRELERRLGFASGYLGDSAVVVRLGRLPDSAEFDLRFYNNVNGGGVLPPNPTYPIGPGYPQWELNSQVPGTIVKIVDH